MTAGYGDFDSHAGQPEQHPVRMQELNAAVKRFFEVLDPAWKSRVTVMTFSEFGRTPWNNDGAGTDHGSSAPHFVFGQNVKGGMYGRRPSMAGPASLGAHGAPRRLPLVLRVDHRRLARRRIERRARRQLREPATVQPWAGDPARRRCGTRSGDRDQPLGVHGARHRSGSATPASGPGVSRTARCVARSGFV